jgi:DeoR family transcriptional regulator, aga operon transcriptional repressor
VPDLTATQRMQRILALLETRDSVGVSELAGAFAVSEVTVRHDLSELARQGLVARVRGGVRPLERGNSELAFDVRLRLQTDEKRGIAQAAAALVGDGEAVALDSSTTAYFLARELRGRRELVVVTNGLLIASALADSPGVTVLLTGGMLRLPAMSVVGELAAETVRTTHIDKGFFGARGLSLERGLMDLNPEEVRVKKELAAACSRVIGIFDSTKWHRKALLPFVGADEVDAIVTDSGAPAELVAAWRVRGVEVVAARPRRRPRGQDESPRLARPHALAGDGR